MKPDSKKVEKTLWEQEKIMVTSIFFPFPKMFWKGFFPRVIKILDCVVKVIKQQKFRLYQLQSISRWQFNSFLHIY